MTKPRIFISYSAKDRPVAEAVHESLESSGFEVWRDKTDLRANWSREIADALADCDLLCLLWTDNAASSRWVKHEWLTARALEKLIVPCLFPEAPVLPVPIRNLHGLAFSSIAKGCEALVERVEKASLLPVRYEFASLPETAYIPFNPNPRFTGRSQDLLELYLKMIGNLQGIGINQVGAVGMGGIGKTQLAVEFALRFSFAFDAVYWIDADVADEWLPKFVSLARDRLRMEIKGIDKSEGEKQYLFALQEHFKKHPDTLVVMDNIADPRELNNGTRLFGVTPLSLGCNLLFTTRRHFQLPGVVSQSIDVLSPRAAFDLLASYREPKSGEENHAKAICNEVGFLPLAITLAGSFLKRYSDDIAFADYVEELEKRKLYWIDIGEISEAELATRHIAAVTATLDDHWKMLQDQDARNLFRLAGQFPETAVIPKKRLGLLAGIAPGRFKIDLSPARAFDILQELCLVERLEDRTNAVRLHPLVREFSNQLVPVEQRHGFRVAAACKLRDFLFVFGVLCKAVEGRGVEEVLEDITVGLEWLAEDDTRSKSLSLLQGALRLSSHVLRHYPGQLAEQLIARLLEETSPEIRKLLEEAARSKRTRWLRPMRASLGKPGGPLLRTLVCENQVTALVSMNDGEHAVSGESDGTLTCWNWKSGTPTAKWTGHSSEVGTLGVSPDGRFLVAMFYDALLKTFDLQNGNEILSVSLAGMDLHSVGVSGDGRIVAFVAKEGPESRISVMALDDKYVACHEVVRLAETDVRALALTENGSKLFWIVDDISGSTLKVLGIAEGVLNPDRAPESCDMGSWEFGPETLAAAPDGRRVVVSSIEDPFAVWDADRKEHRRRFDTAKGHWMLAVSPDGRRGVSTDKGGALSLWDLENLSEIAQLSGHTNLVHAVAVTPDGRRALSAGGDNTVKVWDLCIAAEGFSESEFHPARAVTALALSPDGRLVAAGSWEGEIAIWNIRHAEPVSGKLPTHIGPIGKLFFIPGSNRLLAFSEGVAVYCDMSSMKCEEEIYLEGGGPETPIAPDGRKVLVPAFGKIRIYDMIEQRTLFEVETDNQYIGPSAITSEGMAVFWSDDGKLRIFRPETGRLLPPIDVSGGRISSLTLSSDGRKAFLGFGDGAIQVCDLENRNFTSLPKEHKDKVLSIAVVAGRDRMVSSSQDGSLAVWDLREKGAVARFDGDSPMESCAIAEDGGVIIAGERSGRMHFLSLEGGEVPLL